LKTLVYIHFLLFLIKKAYIIYLTQTIILLF